MASAPQQSSVSPHNSRIMLQSLVLEAARYHHQQRMKASRATMQPDVNAEPTTKQSRDDTLGDSPNPTSPIDASPGRVSPTPSNASSNRSNRSNVPEYMTEEWLSLLDQVTYQYETTYAQTTEERFLKTKCRLTPLFMWNLDSGVEKDIDVQAHDVLSDIAERHRRRLSMLPPGKLFL